MRPNSEEVLRTVQQSLVTYVLPELQSDYARTELMVTIALLGITAGEQDGAAQRLVDDNASLRDLVGRAADLLPELGDELRAACVTGGASVRLTDLRGENVALRGALAQAGVALEGRAEPDLRALRAEVIEYLRTQAEGQSRGLMGPRADG